MMSSSSRNNDVSELYLFLSHTLIYIMPLHVLNDFRDPVISTKSQRFPFVHGREVAYNFLFHQAFVFTP